MIHLSLQDLRHDRLTFGFSVLGLGVLVFAFLLLVPLSQAVGRLGEAGGVPQNLILLERDVLQPEMSRIEPDLESRVSDLLGDRTNRIDPVIFRILRIQTHPIQLRGVDPGSWPTTFRLRLTAGAWPSLPSEVVLGQLAAEAGGWGLGDSIEVYGSEFRVAGIADGPGTKTRTLWMSYAAASDLFGPQAGAQALVVHLQPWADPLVAQEDLAGGLPASGAEYEVYFEDAMLREYGAALSDLRSLSALTAIVAFVAVSLGSHSLAWLAAEERRHSLGMLRAIGFDRRAVGGYLLLRAGAISAAAYLLALTAALVFLGRQGDLTIGGTQTTLTLSPATAAIGLLLSGLAGLSGTWMSVRGVLADSPATLLDRGPGSSFA